MRILFLFLLHLPLWSFAQTCAIQSASSTCLGDLISFSAQTTGGTPTATDWDFGNGQGSAQTNPVYTYPAAGNFTVRLITTFPGGVKCTAQKSITVYALPKLKFTLDGGNDYCLNTNKVCLTDSTLPGTPGTQLVRRLVLWGDGGKSENTFAGGGSKVCYSYQRAGTYTIVIEVTDNKGCKAKTQLQVTILDHYTTRFRPVSSSKGCDSMTFCFDNDSNYNADRISYLEWDWGDGHTEQTFNANTRCHTFSPAGTYNVKLTTVLKNGCRAPYSMPVLVSFSVIKKEMSNTGKIKCFGSTFTFGQKTIPGVRAYWYLCDSNGKNCIPTDQGFMTSFSPPEPGKYTVKLRMEAGSCIREYFDTIEVVGIKAMYRVNNQFQCGPRDTMFFCPQVYTYKAGKLSYLYSFGDGLAKPCTTWTAQNQNIGVDCNWSRDANAMHKYKSAGCFNTSLVVTEDRFGCVSKAENKVYTSNKYTPQVSASAWCKGSNPSMITFSKDSCMQQAMIMYDSCAGSKWDTFLYNSYHYVKTCDTSGWVTVGFIFRYGSEKVYRSCDPSDFYIDRKRLCVDTVWKHHWFRLYNGPDPATVFTDPVCAPDSLRFRFSKPSQPYMGKVEIDWNDGSVLQKDTLIRPDTLLRPYAHLYRKNGEYYPLIKLSNIHGCFQYSQYILKLGFRPRFTHDSVLCPGQPITFRQSTFYYKDLYYSHWADTIRHRKHAIWWDFDDGKGFSVKGPETVHIFPQKGTYTVRMLAIDSNGCTDTFTKKMDIGFLRAGIKSINKKIICDDIIQLFDSSFSDNNTPMGKIVKYWWDFGDGKTPSYLKNPFHYYSSYGTFNITHVIESQTGCTDTARTQIKISGPEPYFDILTDTIGCAPLTVTFKSKSNLVSNWVWYMGDPLGTTVTAKRDTQFSFTYAQPGVYDIYLLGSDSVVNPNNNQQIYYCKAWFPDTTRRPHPIRRVVVLPRPKVSMQLPPVLCAGKPVPLLSTSDAVYKNFRWTVNGKFKTDTTDNPAWVISSDTGLIDVELSARYPLTSQYPLPCYDTARGKVRFVKVRAIPAVKDSGRCGYFLFSSLSEGNTSQHWDFGHPKGKNGNTSDMVTARHDYGSDSGTYRVCLVAVHEAGCEDTACISVRNNSFFSISIPNVITPDNDGLNDLFEIDAENETQFVLHIYDRRGTLVYHTGQDYTPYSNPLNWNGRVMNIGTECPSGTYYFILEYRRDCYEDKDPVRVSGSITLLRPE